MMAAVAFSRGEKGSRLLRAFGLHTPFLGAGYNHGGVEGFGSLLLRRHGALSSESLRAAILGHSKIQNKLGTRGSGTSGAFTR
jgi:hypothetical protein